LPQPLEEATLSDAGMMAERFDPIVKHRALQEGPYRSLVPHDLVLAAVRLPSASTLRLGRVEIEPGEA
jgi:hypothetical protein